MNTHEFDVVSAILGTSVPEDTVEVHTDGQALYDLTVCEAAMNALTGDESEEPKRLALQEQINGAKARLEASTLVVTVKPCPTTQREGIVAKHRKANNIAKDEDIVELTEEEQLAFFRTVDDEIMSQSIVKITRKSDGAEQTTITPEVVQGLRALPGGYYDKIVTKFQTLLMEQIVYSAQADDPNFS